MEIPNPNITNDHLARLFFDVMSKTSLSIDLLRMALTQIKNCPVTISEVYNQAGSLGQIHIPRLAKSHYPVLERILHDGVSRASEAAVNADIKSMKAKSFIGIPGSSAAHVHPESTSGSWENSAKARENDEDGESAA
jgi:hypothetical protein